MALETTTTSPTTPQDERLRYVALQRPETDDLTVGAKRSFVEEGFSPFLGFHETNQLYNIATLQRANISVHIPPGEKENHLQNCLGRGYVSSQEGSLGVWTCQHLPRRPLSSNAYSEGIWKTRFMKQITSAEVSPNSGWVREFPLQNAIRVLRSKLPWFPYKWERIINPNSRSFANNRLEIRIPYLLKVG